jgi:hypothetical protein
MRTYQFGVKGQGKTKLKEFTIEDTNPPATPTIQKQESSHMFGPLRPNTKPKYIQLAIVAVTIGKQQAFQEVSKSSFSKTLRTKNGVQHEYHSLSYPLLNPSVKKQLLQFFKPGIKNNNTSDVNVWIVGSSLPTTTSRGHVIYMFSDEYLFGPDDPPPSKNRVTNTQKQKAKETLRKYSLLMDGSKIIQLFRININEPKSVSVGSIVLHTIIGKNQWNSNNHTVDPGFRNRIQQLHNTLTNKKRKSTVQSTDPAKKQKTTSLFDRVFIGANKYMPEHVLIQENKKLLYIFYPRQLMDSDSKNTNEKTMNKIKKYMQTKVSEPGYVIKYVPYYTSEDNRDIYILSSDLGRGGKMHQIDLIVSPYINNMNSNKKPVIRITNIPTRNND